ncbi:hypothetical protein D3C72_2031090 [compost metagenome]
MQPQIHMSGSGEGGQQGGDDFAFFACASAVLKLLEDRLVFQELPGLLAVHMLGGIEHAVQPQYRQQEQKDQKRFLPGNAGYKYEHNAKAEEPDQER